MIDSTRFVSMKRTELGVIRYRVTSLSESVKLTISPYIDADVRNADANYDEVFWDYVDSTDCGVQMRTKKSNFDIAWVQNCYLDGAEWSYSNDQKRVSQSETVTLSKGEQITLYKYVGICSSLNHRVEDLLSASNDVATQASALGFDALLSEHEGVWHDKWEMCDIEIYGDKEAQQGIRYCIFMLLQTYTGVDVRLNIGPKGFTGEKYGGVTYWDTEAYCLPFYMSTVGQDVARELLIYRYNQLDKAIENGAKLGFTDGAALYPMVTINGEECHNEWEITFEEIHRNGAIAYAIYNYIRYTGDQRYLSEYGLEVLVAISRFWAQRVSYSHQRSEYVMLGVTGPNEYENNVNNNWYTNYIARWTLKYTAQSVEWVKRNTPELYNLFVAKREFDELRELSLWQDIADNICLPHDPKLGIFLQQDGYMDKEQMLVADLPLSERPINQKWSWDRILRSCFIKQADVLQGIYFFQDDFDTDTIARNYSFYESRTLHESSLSACVHSILAAKIGRYDKAYEMYLRTARLDLDDYNNENHEGLHVTSMAGSWLAVVEGFGGMRVKDGTLYFSPSLPDCWDGFSFKVNYQGRIIRVVVTRDNVAVETDGEPVDIVVDGLTKAI